MFFNILLIFYIIFRYLTKKNIPQMTIYLTSSPKLGYEGMQQDVLFNCSSKLGELSAGLRGMSITYYLLPITYYLLLITYYLLPITYQGSFL